METHSRVRVDEVGIVRALKMGADGVRGIEVGGTTSGKEFSSCGQGGGWDNEPA